MSVIKQTMTYTFSKSIPVTEQLLSGTDKNIAFLMDSIETSIEMTPESSFQRPPRVSDVSPVVENDTWKGIEVTFDRKGLIQGGGFVKPQEVKEVVKQELDRQGFKDIKIEDTNINMSR